MSLFDDDDNAEEYYYEAEDKFQQRVLKNAQKLEKHPLAHLAIQLSKGAEAMEAFCEQDPHLSKSERIAIESDIEEAKEALSKACVVIPAEVTDEQ
jgi:hypothetical protein